ncbi:MAG TPA: hypothetical protein VJG49_01640 [Candidatus Nanoarchaeia archaeon]|nr:hypothetical protein [Candidatus Nanoarchaeia archaeon]
MSGKEDQIEGHLVNIMIDLNKAKREAGLRVRNEEEKEMLDRIVKKADSCIMSALAPLHKEKRILETLQKKSRFWPFSRKKKIVGLFVMAHQELEAILNMIDGYYRDRKQLLDLGLSVKERWNKIMDIISSELTEERQEELAGFGIARVAS